jgi:hypothetical protein
MKYTVEMASGGIPSFHDDRFRRSQVSRGGYTHKHKDTMLPLTLCSLCREGSDLTWLTGSLCTRMLALNVGMSNDLLTTCFGSCYDRRSTQ